MRAVGGAHSSEDGGIFAFRQRYFTASRNPAVTMPAINGSFKNNSLGGKYETQNIAFRHLESLQPGPNAAINAIG
jgi:hypothetical protein